MSDCGPFVCSFPDPATYRWLARWSCPGCGTTYVRARKVPERPWRNWSAPDGHWILPFSWRHPTTERSPRVAVTITWKDAP